MRVRVRVRVRLGLGLALTPNPNPNANAKPDLQRGAISVDLQVGDEHDGRLVQPRLLRGDIGEI